MKTVKKSIAVLLSILMLCSVMAVAGVSASAADDTTIYFVNTSNWEDVSAYVWTGGTAKEAWPGEAATLVDLENNVYSYDVESYENVIFNGDAGSNQTATITCADNYGKYYVKSTEAAYDTLEEALEAAASAVTYDYFVAGEEALCGVNWDATSVLGGMTDNGDGTYTKVYENIAAGTYQFKVTDGNDTWYPAQDNETVTVDVDASTVAITFDSATTAITATVTAPEDPTETETETETSTEVTEDTTATESEETTTTEETTAETPTEETTEEPTETTANSYTLYYLPKAEDIAAGCTFKVLVEAVIDPTEETTAAEETTEETTAEETTEEPTEETTAETPTETETESETVSDVTNAEAAVAEEAEEDTTDADTTAEETTEADTTAEETTEEPTEAPSSTTTEFFTYELVDTGDTVNGVALYAVIITDPTYTSIASITYQVYNADGEVATQIKVEALATLDDYANVAMNAETGEVAEFVVDQKTEDTSETASETETETETSAATYDYYVVGSETLFGVSWATDPANGMTLGEDGDYYLTKENVAAGTYEFKVVDANGGWHPDGVDNNCTVTVDADGATVTFRYNVEQGTPIATADGTTPTYPTEEPTTESTEATTESTEPTTEPATTAAPKLTVKKTSLKAGKTTTASVTGADDATVTYSSSKAKIAKVNKTSGKITALKKGTTTIKATITYSDGTSITKSKKVEVTSNPKLKVANKTVKKLTVKVGKAKKVKITGKAAGVKTTYKVKKTKIAKVTNKKSASFKIKGKKAGKTNVIVKVNGKKITLKVTVKK